MHLHAIDPTRSCERRRIDGVNSTPSSRRSYRYSTASMAWGGQMGRRAADRARSSRRRRGAGGRCRRPLSSLCVICGLRVAAFCLRIARVAASQSCCSVHSLQAIAERNLLRVTAVVCVRTVAETIWQSVYKCARARPRKKEPHRHAYDARPHAMPSNSAALFPKDATRRNPSLHNRAL